jgi:hypothetical protein
LSFGDGAASLASLPEVALMARWRSPRQPPHWLPRHRPLLAGLTGSIAARLLRAPAPPPRAGTPLPPPPTLVHSHHVPCPAQRILSSGGGGGWCSSQRGLLRALHTLALCYAPPPTSCMRRKPNSSKPRPTALIHCLHAAQLPTLVDPSSRRCNPLVDPNVQLGCSRRMTDFMRRVPPSGHHWALSEGYLELTTHWRYST